MIVSHLFTMGVPVAEKVIRTVAVYAALAVLLRIFGKRDLAQLNTHDLVVVMLVSNVVQNAIIGADDSLWGGVLGVTTLFLVNVLVVRGMRGNAKAERLFEGSPTVLVHDGRYDEAALRHEGIRRGDLDRALRVQGADGVAEVEVATLSPGGAIVVELKPADQNVSHADLDSFRRHVDTRLDEIAEALGRLAAAP